MGKNRTLKQLLLLLLLTISSISAWAGNVEYLTFNVSGSPIVIALSEHPIITYTDNTLHIKTANESIDIPVDEFSGAVFSETTDIKFIKDPQLQMNEGNICFNQLPPDSKVVVCAANGVEVMTATVDSNGQTVVEIGNLPKGVYIIKSAKQSIKITNK